jgi:S-DNA-T family DNA segregation ATPase FtsK/SpoIIIE
MAKRNPARKQPSRTGPPPELVGLFLLGLALVTGLSLLSASRGLVTEEWMRLLTNLVGWGVYPIPLLLAGLGIWLLRRFAAEDLQEQWEKPIGVVLLFLLLLTAFDLGSPGAGAADLNQPGAGGLVGWAIAELVVGALGTAGSIVLLAGLAMLCLVLLSGLSLAEIIALTGSRATVIGDWRRRHQLAGVNHQPLSPLVEPAASSSGLLRRLFGARSPGGALPDGRAAPAAASPVRAGAASARPADGPASLPAPGAPASGLLFPRVVGAQTWRLPMLESIFEEGVEQEVSQQEIRTQVRIIEETLASFGIEARVREINQGPAVTQFGIEPGYLDNKDAQGRPRRVRVSRIVNLSNDLALALSASPIRIEAPIPGRPYVGIEVPNATKSLVSLRSIMESEAFQNSHGVLRFGLGRDVAGQPIVADLAIMPHLLIAGATGSGKSVCINAIIASFLATHTPETLRMVMIDPKMVELVTYTGIPHLLAPVVVELERVVGVLNWTTREMQRRYKLFSRQAVRNLTAYNELMLKQGDKTMPYVVVIIDELADLMMTAPDEIERAVTRIAQMARATGIHLIIATQRPSVDVVTGLIKANFPARIAFAVTSQIDSRVILDTPGAERLLGRGDMLFMAPDTSKLQRLQGAYVSDRELSRLVRFWKSAYVTEAPARDAAGGWPAVPDISQETTGTVQPAPWLTLTELEAGPAQASPDEDDLLPKAVEVIRSQGRASISLLQRKLRIGYARAARLIDLMEEQGIIGPDEGGGRSRPVLPASGDPEPANRG